jgi:hypothetical protein
MIWTVLLSAAALALCVLLIKFMTDLGERYFTRAIGSTLNETEQIVNEDKLPEKWVQPFRERIEAIQRKGETGSKAERVGQKARKRCLRGLDALTKFYQERDVTDSEDTRQLILNALKERRAWVETATWQDLLAPATSDQDAAEPPTED